MDPNNIAGWKLCKSSQEELLQILKCGWHPDPVKRPSASVILEQLRKWRSNAPVEFLSIELVREQVRLEQRKAKMKAKMAAKAGAHGEAIDIKK